MYPLKLRSFLPVKKGLLLKLAWLSVTEVRGVGQYPVGGEITLQAKALSGYAFMGWKLATHILLIAK